MPDQKPIDKQFTDLTAEQLKKLDEKITKVFNRAGKEMEKTTKALQDKNNNYASGNLRKLTIAKVKKENEGISIDFGSNASNRGYNYGIVQEFGRKAGKGVSEKGQEDLLKWLRKKIRLGHMKAPVVKKGQKRKEVLEGIVFLIAQKIKYKGIKGKFYYQKGFKEGVALFEKEINEAIEEAFK